MKKAAAISFIDHITTTILNSYAILFFSDKKFFAVVVILASFFNPYTGLAGFVATLIAASVGYFIGFSREEVKSGLYTYSAALLGLGMGTFYEFRTEFWILLALASLLSVLLSAAFIAILGKRNLPALSLAFIFTLWIVILSSEKFAVIGLTQRNIYWLNEMYATGGPDLIYFVQQVENFNLPDMVAGFLRSISAILFQSNIAAGILLTIGLLFFSRIALTLMIAGYVIALTFIHLMDGYAGSVNYYNLGTNFMLVSVALGGFYIIPSARSFLWSLITVPISYILVIALWKVTYTWGLPVFSLPFCITVILFLFVLQIRKAGGKMVLTPIQYFSPEENLYRYTNNKERVLNNLYYYHLALPFMGDWTVSQGYDGSITHKGDWGKALDFVITDKEMKTYQEQGSMPEHFYCYNKPVLSPADGIVEEIIDYVPDNEVGGNNTKQNWGNTIVIRHAEGLFTKLSHLKHGSFKVAKGAYVKRGEIVAACGSSGRSPEPHLHFQVQATPYFDSKTMAYPLAYFLQHDNGNHILKSYSVPPEGSIIGNIVPNTQLQQAFDFPPGFIMKVAAPGYKEEEWEVKVSMYNETYFHCNGQNDYAYFINNGTVFYFTNYFGNRRSLLYLFFQAAYKVILSTDKKITITDTFSQNLFGRHALNWIQDLLAPFHIFMKIKYTSSVKQDDDMMGGGTIVLSSQADQYMFGIIKPKMSARVAINKGKLQTFCIEFNNKKIEARCEN